MSDKDIIRAIKAQNTGHFGEAAALFNRAGNKERPPEEKKALWAAAEKARKIRDSE